MEKQSILNKKIRPEFFKKLFYVFVVITLLAFWYIIIVEALFYEYDELANEEEWAEEETSECNVLGLELRGVLDTYESDANLDEEGYPIDDITSSEMLVLSIQGAEENPDIKAILLEIDSYGGIPMAGEEVANALSNAKKPTVALIRRAGISSAYWAALGADTIIASELSDVGGIGVTMSYLSYEKMNQTEGITYNQISSAKFKDAGDEDKPLTREEEEYFKRDTMIMHEIFVKKVAEARGLSQEEADKLADGTGILGQAALEAGLIDKLGDINMINDHFTELIGEEAVLCWE